MGSLVCVIGGARRRGHNASTTDVDVLPMVIYTEFTLQANFAVAGALSIVLGLITWAVLTVARQFAGTSVAAAG